MKDPQIPGLAAARLWAATRQPYLAHALFAMRVVEQPGLGRFSVDERWRLHADPEVAAALRVDQLGTVLVHHVGHLLRDHAGRARDASVRPGEAPTWVRAADFEINDDLVEAGMLSAEEVAADLPSAIGAEPGGLAEEYYGMLLRETDEPEPSDCGSGAHGQDGPPAVDPDQESDEPTIGPGEARLLRQAVAVEIRAETARHAGSVPGGWRRWAEAVLAPTVDWRRVLAAELRRGVASVSGRVDYSYSRPSRRAVSAPGVVLPSLRRPVPEVAVVVDTSASMTEELLESVLAEVDGILRNCGLKGRLRVLAVDTEVHAVRRVATARAATLIGGGGTDMGRGIRAAAALRPRPSVTVVLTDGWTPWPADPPPAMHVVVGLLHDPGVGPELAPAPPAWARTVRIGASTT